ncbi:MAG TPA: three-Cys-motif partner protein TcmP, partial [Rhabdochlamydiaceae bacterium]
SSQQKYGKKVEAAYIDLFSGPGSYEDGSRSTPLLIVKAVLKKQLFSKVLKTFFNDKDAALIKSLQQEIGLLPDIEKLLTRPVYMSQTASIALIDSFELSIDIPQFFFLDQFGYADIKPDLIRRIFINRKCDCAFFFRTSRVIAAITNPKSEQAMQSLFGDKRLLNLRAAFASPCVDKEHALLEALKSAMLEEGAVYFQVFPFRIHEERSSKHHLVYLGKHQLGLSIMKDIMDRSSSTHHGDVPVMGFSEVPAHPSLFEVDPIPDLQRELLKAFAGKSLSVGSVYTSHHPNGQFVLRNYQEALRRLEESGEVTASPILGKRPKRYGKVTMGESVQIRFPSESERK